MFSRFRKGLKTGLRDRLEKSYADKMRKPLNSKFETECFTKGNLQWKECTDLVERKCKRARNELEVHDTFSYVVTSRNVLLIQMFKCPLDESIVDEISIVKEAYEIVSGGEKKLKRRRIHWSKFVEFSGKELRCCNLSLEDKAHLTGGDCNIPYFQWKWERTPLLGLVNANRIPGIEFIKTMRLRILRHKIEIQRMEQEAPRDSDLKGDES
ncbi:hypothetical protein Tco_0403583 [Tanacetum coccineum]